LSHHRVVDQQVERFARNAVEFHHAALGQAHQVFDFDLRTTNLDRQRDRNVLQHLGVDVAG